MSKIDEVRSEMMAAMKAHDKERKDALSALLTALKNKFIDKRADLTEEEENEVVEHMFEAYSDWRDLRSYLKEKGFSKKEKQNIQ